MVVKRQCSFCAGEVEPGTGTMFVKRDGTVFFFCSGSCRKQQLHLGRVGHRLKWTRAHSLKRAAQQSTTARSAERSAARAAASGAPAKAAPPKEAAPSEPKPAAAPAAPAEPAKPKTAKPRAKKDKAESPAP
jgi:large subunit ribosomal protein L24e